MACFHPIRAYRGPGRTKNGKVPVVFKPTDGYVDLPLQLPCGQCIGCRLERSRQWAIRCIHEASLWPDNCFLTLTFDDAHLKPSLCKRDFQLFMKRLRKAYPDQKIRYFHCGEYGEKFSRPHHHAILFNFDFPDKVFFKMSGKHRLYVSESLNSIWGQGYCMIGDVSFDSAAYVARYILKKVTGESAEEHYGDLIPEYVTMSRRPGIAAGWYDKFKDDVFPDDEVVLKGGLKARPPKYYFNKFEIDNPKVHARLSKKRFDQARASADNCPSRRQVKEECTYARIKHKKRSIEE